MLAVRRGHLIPQGWSYRQVGAIGAGNQAQDLWKAADVPDCRVIFNTDFKLLETRPAGRESWPSQVPHSPKDVPISQCTLATV